MARRGWSLALIVLFASCHSSGRSTSTRPTSTTAVARTATTTFGAYGSRVFSVENVRLAKGEWLTIGLHPTEVPIGVAAVSSIPLEVCAANLADGSLVDAVWPGRNFRACLPLAATGRVALPTTNDHASHLAFAVRALSAGAISKVTINYASGDGFVLVTPPLGRGNGMRVTFTPLLSTVGAQAFAKRASGSVAGVQLALNQAGRPIMMMGPCSFPAELTSCFQGMQPNKTVTVTVTVRDNLPSSDAFGLYLEWQP